MTERPKQPRFSEHHNVIDLGPRKQEMEKAKVDDYAGEMYEFFARAYMDPELKVYLRGTSPEVIEEILRDSLQAQKGNDELLAGYIQRLEKVDYRGLVKEIQEAVEDGVDEKNAVHLQAVIKVLRTRMELLSKPQMDDDFITPS